MLYAIAGRGDRDMQAAIARLAVGSAMSVGLLFVAAALDGRIQSRDLGASRSPSTCSAPTSAAARAGASPAGHFAERHALIVIIALGETIVALGLAASHELDAGVVVAGVLGFAIAAALWWLYFDVVAIVAERKLHQLTGIAQLTMARDSYSYLHLPMVAGSSSRSASRRRSVTSASR